MDRNIVRELTGCYVYREVNKFKSKNPDKGSFILSDAIPANWPNALMPFYSLYNNDRVAGAELGKILGGVAKDLGLEAKKEMRFGKPNAITRYFFKV